HDPRLRFENLKERGRYPRDRKNRHLVAGVPPLNRAMELSRGDWIAHLDDDDEWQPRHVEMLVRAALERDLEFVWSRFRFERSPGEWLEFGSADFSRMEVPHSTVMFRTYLRLFQYDIDAWKWGLGTDWHRFHRMRLAGVRGGFVNEVDVIAPLRPGNTKTLHEAEDREP